MEEAEKTLPARRTKGNLADLTTLWMPPILAA